MRIIANTKFIRLHLCLNYKNYAFKRGQNRNNTNKYSAKVGKLMRNAGWWNEKVSSAVERKKEAYLITLQATNERLWKARMRTYKYVKKKVTSLVTQSKRETN